MTERTEVLIVGAGPTGPTAAVRLARPAISPWGEGQNNLRPSD